MPFPVRRVLAGFAAGAAAGWFAGLLRTPTSPAPDSSAGAAGRLPQREFGTPPAGEGLPPGVQEEAPATATVGGPVAEADVSPVPAPDGSARPRVRSGPSTPPAEPVTEA